MPYGIPGENGQFLMGYKIKQNSQRVESSKIKFIKNKV